MMACSTLESIEHIADWDISDWSVLTVVLTLRCCTTLEEGAVANRNELYSSWAVAASPPFMG